MRHSTAGRPERSTRVTLPLSSVLTRQFFRITSMNFFFFASVNAFVLLPLYIHRLGGNEAQIRVGMGMYNAAGIFCQPLVGAWVDRVGRRPFMVFGISLVVAASLGFNLFASLALFAALRAFQGIGFSAFFVSNYTMVVDLVPPERRGWALGIFGISGLLSTALSPLAGELLIRARATIPVLPFLFLSGLLAGGAHGLLYPALAALLMDETAEARRGSVVGIFSSVFLAWSALGAFVFGYVIHGW